MTFLEFIASISFLVVLTGCFISGWFRITRYHIVVQPDNTETVEGYLFKWWSYWIEKVKETKQIYYRGDALNEKYDELKRLLPSIGAQLSVGNMGDFLLVNEGYEISKEEIDRIERVLKVKVGEFLKNKTLYIEEDVYYLPSWVRNPLSQCPICMSSVYGSLSYWSFVFLADGAFNWTSHKFLAILLIFCFYLVVLSQISYLLAKKT